MYTCSFHRDFYLKKYRFISLIIVEEVQLNFIFVWNPKNLLSSWHNGLKPPFHAQCPSLFPKKCGLQRYWFELLTTRHLLCRVKFPALFDLINLINQRDLCNVRTEIREMSRLREWQDRLTRCWENDPGWFFTKVLVPLNVCFLFCLHADIVIFYRNSDFSIADITERNQPNFGSAESIQI